MEIDKKYSEFLAWKEHQEEAEKRLASLTDAIKEGNVETMTSSNSEDLLYEDMDNTIHLIRDTGLGDGVFGISVADGGGFTGVIFVPEQWREMNAKVEKFMREKGI